MSESAVAYRAVTYAYPDETGASRCALEDVTLQVAHGERLGVLGPNGGGKSTLLKLTLGLLNVQQGEVRVFGRTPREAVAERLIGYVPQRSETELAFPVSVREAAGMAAAASVPAWRPLPRDVRDAVEQAMVMVGVDSLADRPIGRLSGGQFQRVMIARALACRPRLLLLDEPMVGVDVVGQQQFAEMLERLHSELGLTIIVVSHDIRTVAAGCDRIACLSRTLHSHVAPKGLTPAVLAEVFRHDVAAIFGDVHVDAHAAAGCTHDHGPVGVTIGGSAGKEVGKQVGKQMDMRTGGTSCCEGDGKC